MMILTAMVLAGFSFVLMLISLLALKEKDRVLAIRWGAATSLCAIFSMRLLHIQLMQSGKENTILGAVYGDWGIQRPIVPIAYSAVILTGIAVIIISALLHKKDGY